MPVVAYKEASDGPIGTRAESALAQLKATDGCENEAPREKPQQEGDDLDAETRQHHPPAGHQPVISLARDVDRGDVQDSGIKAGFKARATLEFGQDRPRTDHCDTHAMG